MSAVTIPCPTCGKSVRHYGTPPTNVEKMSCLRCTLNDVHEAKMSHYDSLWAFAHEVIQQALSGDDLPGGEVQELAVKYGLIQPAIYDPEIHGRNVEAEPGDEIFEFTEEMR